jgi:hypothetical protein
MRKKIIIVFILFSCALLFAAEPVAYLVKTKGSVQLYRDQKSFKYKNGELLYNSDELITDAQSYAAVKYVDGAATVKIFPNSVVKITAVTQDKQLNKNSVVTLGSLYSKVSKKIKGMYQVETPNTVASVKGTGFITRYDADKKTHVIVLEGEVLVQNKDSGKSKSVSKGSSATSGLDGEVNAVETQAGEVTDTEQHEIDAINQDMQKTIRVQIIDENGKIKYIDMTY